MNKTNFKITFNIGFNDREIKEQLITTDTAKALIVKTILACGFDGLTMIDTFGVYAHDDGVKVQEHGAQVQVQVFDATEEEATAAAIDFCDIIGAKNRLNQESVIYDVKELTSVMHFTK